MVQSPCVLGSVLLWVGVRQKRGNCVIVGCALMVAVIISIPWFLSVPAWVGHTNIAIAIRVQEATDVPVRNANVKLAIANEANSCRGTKRNHSYEDAEWTLGNCQR